MEIEREIEKVLRSHGITTMFNISDIVSDLSRLMELELVKAASNSAWATTGSTRKRVTRNDIAEIFGFRCEHQLESRSCLRCNEKIDTIMSLLDGDPSRRWCSHLSWKNREGDGFLSGYYGENKSGLYMAGDNWTCCPICGKERPRPVETAT